LIIDLEYNEARGNMSELVNGARQRRPRVMILAEDRAAAQWAQALSEDRVVCLIATNVATATKLLKRESMLDLLLVERNIMEQKFRALSQMMRATSMWPVIVPIRNRGRKPTKLDRNRVLAALALMHSRKRSNNLLRLGDLTIDMARKRAKYGRRRWVQLPPMQYQLLVTLARTPNQVLSFRDLLRQVWGYEGSKAEAQELVKAHVRLIRRKMGWNPRSGEYLRSIRGFGYMLAVPE
jgi:DNA-binding response OmpR family regulator